MAIETFLSIARQAGHEPPPPVAKYRGSQYSRRQQASGVGYNSAGGGRRSAGWNTTVQGVNSIFFADGFKLLQRSRDQVRQNPWAASAIDKFVSNAIGNGHQPHPQHPDPAVREAITKAWRRSNDELDADGVLPFDGQQALIARAGLEGGECFVHMMTDDDDENSVPLKLRVMEAEQLPMYYSSFPTVQDDNIVRLGIEFAPITRKRVAYHFYQEHPYETVMFPFAGKIIRIPAKDIAHHFRPLRPGQVRGLPWLAPVLTQLYEIDCIQDAELARTKVQALFGGFITVNSADPGGNPLDESTKISSDPTGASGLDTATPSLEPASLIKLLPNEEITFAEPKGASGYSDFMRTALHSVAGAMGVTFEQLTTDLSEVNYSSIRAGLLEFRRLIEQYQTTTFAFQVLRPVWRRWMATAVLAGVLPFRDFLENRSEYESVIWQPPGFDWVDPLKDVQASILAIRAGLDSKDRIVRERGLDPETVDRDNKIAQDRANKLGLVYESDASNVLTRGETLDDSSKEEEQQKAAPKQPSKKRIGGTAEPVVLQ